MKIKSNIVLSGVPPAGDLKNHKPVLNVTLENFLYYLIKTGDYKIK